MLFNLSFLLATTIPKSYFENLPNDLSVKEISFNLITTTGELAQLNPELIYYYLKFAKDQNIYSEDSLKQIVNYYKFQKLLWVQSLKEAIKKQIADSLYLKIIFEKLDLWSPKTDGTPKNHDSQKSNFQNERDYLVLKYYNIPQNNAYNVDNRHFLSSVGLYDENIAYKAYREKIEAQKRNSLFKLARLSKSIKILKYFIDNYYLFSQPDHKSKAFHVLIQMLRQNNEKNPTATRIVFTISPGYLYLRANSGLYETTSFDFTEMKLKFNRKPPYHSLILGFHLIYSPKRFVLKSNLNINPYWYFKLNAYVYKIKNNVNSFSKRLTSNYSIGGKDYLEIMDVDGTYNSFNSWGIASSFSFPIFAKKDNFGIEIGLFYATVFSQYKLDYSYKFKKFVSYWSGFPNHEFYQTLLLDESNDTVMIRKNDRESFFFLTGRFYVHFLESFKLNFMTGGVNLFKVSISYTF